MPRSDEVSNRWDRGWIMSVETIQTPFIQYQIFTDSNLSAIKEIERQSKLMGLRTRPIILFDSCNSLWQIHVEKIKV